MTLDNKTIINELTSIFHNVFGDDDLVIDENTTSQDVEGWDSLAHIRLIVSIERAFNIRFAASEVSDLANVGALAHLIMKKRLNG